MGNWLQLREVCTSEGNDDVRAIRRAKRPDFPGSGSGAEGGCTVAPRGSRLINIRAIKVLPRRLALNGCCCCGENDPFEGFREDRVPATIYAAGNAFASGGGGRWKGMKAVVVVVSTGEEEGG